MTIRTSSQKETENFHGETFPCPSLEKRLQKQRQDENRLPTAANPSGTVTAQSKKRGDQKQSNMDNSEKVNSLNDA